MNKRVYIIHGWDGFPEEGWFPWLKKELQQRGFEVFVPQMPDAESPRINKWVPALAKAVTIVNSDTFFIGHSMGCQTIARYLESLPEGVKAGGAVFVAGFFKRLTNLEDDAEVQDIAHEWLKTPLDLKMVRVHLPKSIAIFSDNDPYVPLDNQQDYKEQLGTKIIIEHSMGHFSGPSDHVTELPIALESLVEISKST